MTPRSAALIFALAASVAACSSDVGGPRSLREVVGHIVSPNGLEGAAVLTVRGRGIGTIEADSTQIFIQRDGADLRVVLVRDTPGAIHFRLRVIDRLARLDADVLAVADGSNRMRDATDGYRVAWVR